MKLKGIGPKIANLYAQIALSKNTGISVDTHCHRIPNRLKWIKTNSPIQTKEKLEEIFEKSEWPHINKILVGFGQEICCSVSPKCEVCPINKLCISDENSTIKKFKKLKLKSED